jgi:MarR family transcriptional regulator for hemolysin
MPLEPFEHLLGFMLNDVSRLLRTRFDQRAKSHGLTRSQWRVLVHLARAEGIIQSGLAEILEVERMTLGRLIDRLEVAGWVERRRDRPSGPAALSNRDGASNLERYYENSD